MVDVTTKRRVRPKTDGQVTGTPNKPTTEVCDLARQYDPAAPIIKYEARRLKSGRLILRARSPRSALTSLTQIKKPPPKRCLPS